MKLQPVFSLTRIDNLDYVCAAWDSTSVSAQDILDVINSKNVKPSDAILKCSVSGRPFLLIPKHKYDSSSSLVA